MDLSIESLSEDTLLLRFGDTIDPAINARVHAAGRAVRAAALPGVTDIAPAYASLLLRFDPFATEPGRPHESPHVGLAHRIRSILADATASTCAPGLRRHDDGETMRAAGNPAPVVEIPVCYGGDCGPDIDTVAAHAGLSCDEVIARHTAAEYRVAMLGFAPGFPYLLGLDPTLHVPRRANPRTRVPAGAVAIGGTQTGIYPRELPGGWNLIGRTPWTLFDPGRTPPARLAPDDRVRFHAIDADEFVRLAERRA